MIRHPYSLPPYSPIIIPDPEVLQKYAKIVKCLMHIAKMRLPIKDVSIKKSSKSYLSSIMQSLPWWYDRHGKEC